MEQVSATRSELLARRARIGLATQGRDLLTERRNALVHEFRRLGASALESIDLLDRDAAEASRQLGLSIAADGHQFVASAALAAAGEVEVNVTTRRVAGVPIVGVQSTSIVRACNARGYSLTATSAHIDEVAKRFERVLDKLLEVAALELSIRRLAEEIARTTRRMNALEHVVLPALEAEQAHIALVLDEREMEDRVRLRRARSSRSNAGGWA